MNDLISRQAAIDYCYALINAENPSDPSDEWNYSQERINQTEVILHHLEFMPSAQPESEERKAESAQNVPKEDLISRKEAIDAECEVCQIAPKKERGHNCTYYVHGCKEIECLRALPSVTPKCPECDDAVSRQAAIDAALSAFSRGLLASPDIRKLPSVQPEPQWIPVSERLPEERGFYLVKVCAEYRPIRIYAFSPWDMDKERKFWINDSDSHSHVFNHFVEAWMPLPEPYRAERRTDESD